LQQRPQTLAEWLIRQQSVHAKNIDLELTRVSAVARKLGVDRPRCPVITVGGTNGKGSVVAHLDCMLRGIGFATGVFTSPHLVRYNERIKLSGIEVTDAELVAAFERIEGARGDITLTYFEYSALAALIVFAQHAVDAVILEVGLGGRLDATNLVDSSVAVVASIGFDHRDWLGNSLEEIGAEKAGIFRAGKPAVLGSPDMPTSVFSAIERVGAKPLVAERDFNWHVARDSWSYRGPRWSFDHLPPSALPGTIQYRNAATAIAALEAMLEDTEVDAKAMSVALRSVELPGRFQIIPGPVEWILDVAHNEPAAQVLARHLKERSSAGRTFGVISVLADKDVAAVGRALMPVFDQWILCSLQAEARGLSAAELQRRLALPEDCSVTLADSVIAGCELARARAKPGDRVVACGSFLVVGIALTCDPLRITARSAP
jgi:dihydrofolate synthase/folylpolyglutamate synthase